MTVQEVFEKVYKTQRIPYRIVISRNDFKYAISDKPASLDGISEEMRKGKVILAFVIEGKYIDPKGEILKNSEELFWEMCTELERWGNACHGRCINVLNSEYPSWYRTASNGRNAGCIWCGSQRP